MTSCIKVKIHLDRLQLKITFIYDTSAKNAKLWNGSKQYFDKSNLVGLLEVGLGGLDFGLDSIGTLAPAGRADLGELRKNEVSRLSNM